MERTTNLEAIKQGAGFTWGDTIKIHEIDKYTVVEYHPWKQKDSTVLSGQADYEVINYHCYFDGRDLSRSTESLDAALAECIAYKHEGLNSRAALYFIKMIS